LTSNYATIRKELEPLMDVNNVDLKPYFDDDIQFPPKNWKTIGFYFWGKKNEKTCERFPKTHEILSQLPGIVSASFNMLEPQSHIKPHFGDTNAVYRAHLGIKNT
jgi:aspartyl/asparaginyl beta-hydroxylase (cupin superfamily)